MNSLKITVVVALLSGCSMPQERHREALMDQVEKQLQLPQGARPLNEYARYYTERNDGELVATYLIPMNYDVRPGGTCEELLANFTTREVPCEPQAKPDWAMPAGERRWVKSEQDLPFICDGGCTQVTVIFDKSKSVVKSAHCNGEA